MNEKSIEERRRNMSDLEEKIHDFVEGSPHPVNINQIFQGLKDAGMDVTRDEVLRAIDNLQTNGFLYDSGLVSYYALG